MRHNKQVRDLDWSPASSSTIQWAAFYSDCKLEILPVTGGECITLIYGLYAVGAGVGYVHPKTSLTPCIQPLKAAVMNILGNPNFMRQGTSSTYIYILPSLLTAKGTCLSSLWHI